MRTEKNPLKNIWVASIKSSDRSIRTHVTNSSLVSRGLEKKRKLSVDASDLGQIAASVVDSCDASEVPCTSAPHIICQSERNLNTRSPYIT